jgi:ribosome-binding protein aMBF1 (putative translation factor)
MRPNWGIMNSGPAEERKLGWLEGSGMSRLDRTQDDLSFQLREAIQESGMSVYRIAKRAGVKHAVVARFLSGERDLRLETASKIAAVLSLSLHSLPRTEYTLNRMGKEK